MRNLIFLLGTGILLFSIASCGFESPRYKALMAQTDSIRSIQLMLEKEVGEFSLAMNHFDHSFDSLLLKEITQITPISTSLKPEHDSLVQSNIAKFNQILQQNANEISRQTQLAAQNASRVAVLQGQVNELSAYQTFAEEKIAYFNTYIETLYDKMDEMKTTIFMLTDEVDRLNAELDTKKETIVVCETESLYGYFIADSRSDLIRRNILTTRGFLCRKNMLFNQGVDKNQFTQINIEETTEIPLPLLVNGRVLSIHPSASYQIVWKDNQRVLQILNPDDFWSVTRFLVIQ